MQETTCTNEVVTTSEHTHVFNADFAMIAISVASVYTYLMVFAVQLMA